MAKILVVDDERVLVKGITFNLKNEGYQVETGYDGEEAVELAREGNFDLIILDLMMPKIDGLQACMRIREFSNVPVIMLTAKGEDADKIMGFECGADDYITKPFSFPVLVAKAQAILRRSRGQSLGAGQLAYGSILLDTALREVTVDGRPIHLRPKELQILEILLREQGRTVSRDTLIQKVWSLDFDGDERMVDRHVAALRQKLGTAAQHIKSVYGAGYRLGGKEGQR